MHLGGLSEAGSSNAELRRRAGRLRSGCVSAQLSGLELPQLMADIELTRAV